MAKELLPPSSVRQSIARFKQLRKFLHRAGSKQGESLVENLYYPILTRCFVTSLFCKNGSETIGMLPIPYRTYHGSGAITTIKKNN